MKRAGIRGKETKEFRELSLKKKKKKKKKRRDLDLVPVCVCVYVKYGGRKEEEKREREEIRNGKEGDGLNKLRLLHVRGIIKIDSSPLPFWLGSSRSL